MPNQARVAGGRTGACGEREEGQAAPATFAFSTTDSDDPCPPSLFMKRLTKAWDFF